VPSLWYKHRMSPIDRILSLVRPFAVVATRFLPETRLISIRVRLLKFAGVKIERYAKLFGYQAMLSPSNVSLGEGSFVNSGCLFEAGGRIDIKSFAMVGPRVIFVTINHVGEKNQDLIYLPITVESYAWIGAGATICPGVTIGHHAVVAAGSVVMRDVAPHVRVAGSPARPLPQRQPEP